MKTGVWLTEKPEFNQECVFVTRQKCGDDFEYNTWQIKALDGEDDKGYPAWYWGLLTGDGEEWGPIDDLQADMYFIIPPPTK